MRRAGGKTSTARQSSPLRRRWWREFRRAAYCGEQQFAHPGRRFRRRIPPTPQLDRKRPPRPRCQGGCPVLGRHRRQSAGARGSATCALAAPRARGPGPSTSPRPAPTLPPGLQPSRGLRPPRILCPGARPLACKARCQPRLGEGLWASASACACVRVRLRLRGWGGVSVPRMCVWV